MRRFWPLLFAGACVLQAAQAPVLYTDQNLAPGLLETLMRGQDLALNLKYDEAEALLRESVARQPEHPLTHVFLLATLLARIQEDYRRGAGKVPDFFYREVDDTVRLAETQLRHFPESPYPRLYLGAAFGMRGLARLYAGSYFGSYRDGKKGAALLRQAVGIAPDLYNAYMGLGQFEYYCGTLGGVLQFLLALPGDPDKGLAMLKTCEEKASYAAWPCKAYRVQLIINDRGDYASVEAELAALAVRYPGNPVFAVAIFQALKRGLNTEALRRAGEDILHRHEQGWSLPPYVRFDPWKARLDLGRAYLQAGAVSTARSHLQRVAAQAPDQTQRAEAQLALKPVQP